ncbi:hypothetical protein J5N97_010434 [Dioscorea zingiberensis]|uniref:NAC domain-containing protein n=1 Tax=Dioscorea zingiberensis TaxID=325984 RepID=A0A9D5D069_9LILI|nr:hypothetical protein J5N97_010434 [Dioscorea zingiberensis]
MCPPPPDWLQFGGYTLSTDEDIVLFLGAWEFGDPIPTNVITEVDPLSIEPWNLPEGMLYLCSFNDPQIWKSNSEIKETSAGYWKSEGGVFRVSTSSFMVGRKTTREFYEGHMPFGKRTGWMMHEYQADQKACQGMMATKEYSSLCRVFRQSDQNPKHEEQLKCVDANCMDDADVDGERVEAMLRLFLEEEERNHSLHDDDGANQTQVITGEEPGEWAISDRNPQDLLADDISVDVDATDEFLEGDFIELNDLCSLASSSSNSDNSINMLDSDEYFDADALLRDLESESGLDMREEHIDCVSTFVRSDQAISRSSPTGSLSIRSHTLLWLRSAHLPFLFLAMVWSRPPLHPCCHLILSVAEQLPHVTHLRATKNLTTRKLMEAPQDQVQVLLIGLQSLEKIFLLCIVLAPFILWVEFGDKV